MDFYYILFEAGCTEEICKKIMEIAVCVANTIKGIRFYIQEKL